MTGFTEHTYDADDPRIAYVGRVSFRNAKRPRFSAPGTYIEARFIGTGAAVLLVDQHRYGSRNYFDVIIDDGPAFKLVPVQAQSSYLIADDLEPGLHTIRVTKRTEANIGNAEFLGFSFVGEIQGPPPRPPRRILFIGDSITCGFGNEAVDGSAECDEDGWGQAYHNARLAYGAVLSRSLDADYHLVAVSGIGLLRNYSSMYDVRPMPEVVDLTFLELTSSPSWAPAEFVADVVVTALGTNDFSPGDSERPKMEVETFTSAYVEFLGKLRRDYPEAHLVVVSSPLLADGWPDPGDRSLTDQRAGVTVAGEHFAAAGDAKVHIFISTRVSGTGCKTHPSVEQHAFLAEELGEFIKTTLGW